MGETALTRAGELGGPPVLNLNFTYRSALAYVLAAIVVLLGLAASLKFKDWSWLSRSGSVIVVIGIVLTSTQIIENSRRLRHRRLHWEEIWRRRLNESSTRDFVRDASDGSLERSTRHDEDKWENEKLGLYMLIIGTLIWGFGDLPGA